MRQLYARHMGIDWAERSAESEVWRAIADVDDSELWDMHQVLKVRLLALSAGALRSRGLGGGSRPIGSQPPRAYSIRTRSPSDSLAASPPTSGRRSS